MPGMLFGCAMVMLTSTWAAARPEKCEKCDAVLVQRSALLSTFRPTMETSQRVGQPQLAVVATARHVRVEEEERRRHQWRPVQMLLELARSDDAAELHRSDMLWVIWGFLIVFGISGLGILACFCTDASRKKLQSTARVSGKGVGKGCEQVKRDFPVPKVPRLPRLQHNAYEGQDAGGGRGLGRQPSFAKDAAGISASSSAQSPLASSSRLEGSPTSTRPFEGPAASWNGRRDGCGDPRYSALSLRAESLCPAPRLPDAAAASDVVSFLSCGVGPAPKRAAASYVRDGCAVASGLAKKAAVKADLACGGPSLTGLVGSCFGDAAAGGRHVKDACGGRATGPRREVSTGSPHVDPRRVGGPKGQDEMSCRRTSFGISPRRPEESPPVTARGAGAKHLCPCLVVPDGMELVFAVRDLISVEKQELSFSVVDVEGQALSHVIVNEVGPHCGILLQMLDQTPLAWVRTKNFHERGALPEICYPTGEAFCVLVREGAAPGYRYVLRDVDGRNLHSYSGDFRDRTINVVSTSGRLIGDTERCELGSDRSPHYQVRVAPGTDAGLVLCGLLALLKLEGGAKASMPPGPMSARMPGPLTARSHAARLGVQGRG